MIAILTQNGLKKAIGGKSKKPTSMTDKQWKEVDENTLSMIVDGNHVLREVLDQITMTDLKRYM